MKQENNTYQSRIVRTSTRKTTSTQIDTLVKQEEDEEETRLKTSLQVVSESPQEAEYNYCNICDKRFKRFFDYDFHMKHSHNKKLKPNYCDKCKKQFQTWKSCSQHMKSIHNTILPKSRILYPDRIPDINDPNCHCNACDYIFSSRTSYRSHLKVIHQVRFPNVLTRATVCPDKIPDINHPDNFCIACNQKYKSNQLFRTHLLFIHNMEHPTSRHRLIKTNKIIKKELGCNNRLDVPNIGDPNIDDPNNYCSVCDRSYSCRKSYKLHILRRHPETRDLLKARLPNCNHGEDHCDKGLGNCSYNKTTKNQ